MYWKSLICVFISLCISCTTQTIDLGKYNSETLNIATNENLLDMTDVEINYVSSLHLPKDVVDIAASKFIYEKGHFLIMDDIANNTVFVFDSLGNFVSKLGTRGHATNEYVRSPSDFFVDDSGKYVHVYDNYSRRILVFSMSGTFVKYINLETFPYSICLSKYNNYFCAFNHKIAKDGLQLGIISPNEEIKRSFLRLKENHPFVSNYKAFWKTDTKIYHIPNLADSVFVFANDTLNKIVKLNFDCGFIPPKIQSDAIQEALDEYHNFKGVRNINCYYETERYILVNFTKSILVLYTMIDKQSGKNLCFTSVPINSYFPSGTFCVQGDKMYYLITKEMINNIKDSTSKKELEDLLSESPGIIRDIINDKYDLPLVVSLRIK